MSASRAGTESWYSGARVTPYLLRRNDIFYFRRAVPDWLVHRLRRRELKVSLRTSCPAIARRRSRVLANAIEALFECVVAMPNLTVEQVDELIRGYFKAQWATLNAALPDLKRKGIEERDNS